MKTMLSLLTAALALTSCDSPTVLRLVDATPGVLDKLGKYNVINERDVALGKEVLADGRELVLELSPQADGDAGGGPEVVVTSAEAIHGEKGATK